MPKMTFDVPTVFYTSQKAIDYYRFRGSPGVGGQTTRLELEFPRILDWDPGSPAPFETLSIDHPRLQPEPFRRVGEPFGTPHFDGYMWFFVQEGRELPVAQRTAVLGLRTGNEFGFLRVVDSFGGGLPKAGELDFQFWVSPVRHQERIYAFEGGAPCYLRKGPIYFQDLVAEAGAPSTLVHIADDPGPETGIPQDLDEEEEAPVRERRGAAPLGAVRYENIPISANITTHGGAYHRQAPISTAAASLHLDIAENHEEKGSPLELITENPVTDPPTLTGRYRLQGSREGYSFLNGKIYFFRYIENLDSGHEPFAEVHRMYVLGLRDGEFGFLREVDALACEMPSGELDFQFFSSPVHFDVENPFSPMIDIQFFADLVVEGGSPAALI